MTSIDWHDLIPMLDLPPAQRVVAEYLELRTCQPPVFMFYAADPDRCLITPKFMTDLWAALNHHFDGLVHVMVGYDDDEPREMVH